jgi:hypothetical protein
MSKMDNLRAMREARYAESQARATATGTASGPAVTAPTAARPERAPTLAVVPDPAEPEAQEELCGHRNMSGRTCTREAGHAAKSHRYS